MSRDLSGLVAFIDSRISVPFRWGANDCASFAIGAVIAQTGADPLDGRRWRTKVEADALLVELGGLEAALDARFERIAPGAAARGDIALVERGGERGVMIVEGATLVGPGPRGARRKPRSAMLAAWKVG